MSIVSTTTTEESRLLGDSPSENARVVHEHVYTKKKVSWVRKHPGKIVATFLLITLAVGLVACLYIVKNYRMKEQLIEFESITNDLKAQNQKYEAQIATLSRENLKFSKENGEYHELNKELKKVALKLNQELKDTETQLKTTGNQLQVTENKLNQTELQLQATGDQLKATEIRLNGEISDLQNTTTHLKNDLAKLDFINNQLGSTFQTIDDAYENMKTILTTTEKTLLKSNTALEKIQSVEKQMALDGITNTYNQMTQYIHFCDNTDISEIEYGFFAKYVSNNVYFGYYQKEAEFFKAHPYDDTTKTKYGLMALSTDLYNQATENANTLRTVYSAPVLESIQLLAVNQNQEEKKNQEQHIVESEFLVGGEKIHKHTSYRFQ